MTVSSRPVAREGESRVRLEAVVIVDDDDSLTFLRNNRRGAGPSLNTAFRLERFCHRFILHTSNEQPCNLSCFKTSEVWNVDWAV